MGMCNLSPYIRGLSANKGAVGVDNKKLFDGLLFWCWCKLSMLGRAPYTVISRKLLLTALIVSLLPPWFRLVYLIGTPIWLLKRYKLYRCRKILYALSAMPIVIYLFSTGFNTFFAMAMEHIVVFALATTAGVWFNKRILPRIMQSSMESDADKFVER